MIEHKDIYNGRYRITNDGKLYSLVFKNGIIEKERKTPKALIPYLRKKSYYWYTISINNRRISKAAHVLVLENFLCLRPQGHFACHKNGISTDNRIGNLYWGTPKQNSHDRYKHGTMIRGEKVRQSKLTQREVELVLNIKKHGFKGHQIAKLFGVTNECIYAILKGKNWKHVSAKRA